jgi:hypothetical protein
LSDYGSPALREKGAAVIAAELAKLPEDAGKSELRARLAAIEQGQRDLNF